MPYLLALALILGAVPAWKLTAMHYERVIDVAAREAAQAIADANLEALASAAAYEEVRAKARVRTVTLTREIEREVHSDPDCSARALPDGLRVALTNAAADADQPGAAHAVPAASAASTPDVGRSGPGLRRPPG